MWDLEVKYCQLDGNLSVQDGTQIEGYASLFGVPDQGGDVVQKGAYAKSLASLAKSGRQVKMLWQHDPLSPIGVWDDVYEDDRGLYVKGRLLDGVQKAQEAATLIEAGALDGLSIGYRTVQSVAQKSEGRRLVELDLWEVSLVTFPMLPTARIAAKSQEAHEDISELAALFKSASASVTL